MNRYVLKGIGALDKLPNVEGIGPLNLFLHNSKSVKLFKFPSEVGIESLNLF